MREEGVVIKRRNSVFCLIVDPGGGTTGKVEICARIDQFAETAG